jgi:hypothetical protein
MVLQKRKISQNILKDISAGPKVARLDPWMVVKKKCEYSVVMY